MIFENFTSKTRIIGRRVTQTGIKRKDLLKKNSRTSDENQILVKGENEEGENEGGIKLTLHRGGGGT